MSQPKTPNILDIFARGSSNDLPWPEMDRLVAQARVWAKFEKKRREKEAKAKPSHKSGRKVA